jgi:hypothetical protein
MSSTLVSRWRLTIPAHGKPAGHSYGTAADLHGSGSTVRVGASGGEARRSAPAAYPPHVGDLRARPVIDAVARRAR